VLSLPQYSGKPVLVLDFQEYLIIKTNIVGEKKGYYSSSSRFHTFGTFSPKILYGSLPLPMLPAILP
jgi:hypothetical protein